MPISEADGRHCPRCGASLAGKRRDAVFCGALCKAAKHNATRAALIAAGRAALAERADGA